MRRGKYGLLFISSLFCEYTNLEYVRVPVIYRVNQAEYVIQILVAASQKYVNTYSTRRNTTQHTTRTTPPMNGRCGQGELVVRRETGHTHKHTTRTTQHTTRTTPPMNGRCGRGELVVRRETGGLNN